MLFGLSVTDNGCYIQNGRYLNIISHINQRNTTLIKKREDTVALRGNITTSGHSVLPGVGGMGEGLLSNPIK
jgi:hypothetical protein